MNSTTIDHGPEAGSKDLNAHAEFEALRSSSVIYDLRSRARVQITGADRVRWLNGMVTNNVRDLAVNHGVYAFLLNPQGHIQADLYVYNRGDFLLIETDQALLEKVIGIFDRYIIMDDVELADVTGKLAGIGIAGPKAQNVLGSAGISLSKIATLELADLKWRGTDLTVARDDNSAVDSFSLWIEPGQTSSLRQALSESGAVPVGAEALELLRIASGIPRYGQDIRERDLPQETEQQRALNFSKGCYIGQEIVERIRSRGAVHRKFTGFEVEGTLPAPAAKIQVEGKEVGEITSAATLPFGEPGRGVALGYIRRELAIQGKELSTSNARLTVAELPFRGIWLPA